MKFTIDKIIPIKEAFDKINLFKYNNEGNGYRLLHIKLLETYKKQGYTKYQWVTKGDDQVRPTHKFLNGKVYEIEAALQPNSSIPFPGNIRINGKIAPREIYGCRCSIRPLK